MPPHYFRQYVHADPTGNPERRHYQVGEKVLFHYPYNKTPSEPRPATVVSHDRYYIDQIGGNFRVVDAFYTIRFDQTQTTRSWVQAAWLGAVRWDAGDDD